MKYLKKVIIVLLTAVFAVSLCGCDSEGYGNDQFSITGKWKSVGDEGFGQAQPGNIVSFDGTKCNLFSPSDTYAFYKEGNDYILDTTSLLGQTVSFKVEVVNSNSIKIHYGGTVTELERKE